MPAIDPLASLFDEYCHARHTELIGHGPLDVAATGDLLFQPFMEHIDQQLANHDVGKEPIEIWQLYLRMRPTAERLCTDFRGALPVEADDVTEERLSPTALQDRRRGFRRTIPRQCALVTAREEIHRLADTGISRADLTSVTPLQITIDVGGKAFGR